MKTGFLYGGARIPKFVYYFYHGKNTQCRKEPWIPPYIYYDTHPAEHPPNYYYECDTYPNGATPPMQGSHSAYITLTIGGGLFDVRTHRDPRNYTVVTNYYWLMHPTSKIEITASFPTMEIDPGGEGYIKSAVYLNIYASIGVWAEKDFTTRPGYPHMYNSFTYIQQYAGHGWYRPFTDNFDIIMEKIPGTNKWNFYFNGEWIFDAINPTLNGVVTQIRGPSSEYGHGTMDYIRAWKDTERF